jgi:hypothetical protein
VALPQRYPGISIALIDACRTDPVIRRGVDDFNQIAAPEGMLVFFATRAGRPALAPISADRNTFFAGALVDVLRDANGVTPVDDLFRIAAVECQARVKAEFDKVKLTIPPQFPESTGNLRGRFVIRNRQLELLGAAQGHRADRCRFAALMDKRWQVIQETSAAGALDPPLPGVRAGFSRQRVRSTDSRHDQPVPGRRWTASVRPRSRRPLRRGNGRRQGLPRRLAQGLRGDKDAAHRIAIAYRDGKSGVAANPRRTEQWLRFAAELGNGIASWELSEIYNQSDQVGDAARFEKKALDLGYRPPPRLATRGY